MQQTILPQQMIRFRKERNFSEKLNATFAFMSEHIKPIGTNIMLIAGPFALLAGICYSVYQSYTFNAAFSDNLGSAAESAPDVGLMAAGIIGMFLFSLLAFTLVVAIVMRHIRLYIAEGHCRIGTEFLWKNIWKDFFSVLGTSVVIMLLFSALMIVVLVPFSLFAAGTGSGPVLIVGVMLFMFFAIFLSSPAFLLLYPIRSIEQKGIFQALSRLFRLISGKWLSTAGLVIVMYIIQMVIASVFSIPMYIILFMKGMHAADPEAVLQGGGSVNDILFSLAGGLSMLGSFALYGLVMIAVTFQYFNLVERRDATGLLERIDTFGEKKDNPEDEEEHY